MHLNRIRKNMDTLDFQMTNKYQKNIDDESVATRLFLIALILIGTLGGWQRFV